MHPIVASIGLNYNKLALTCKLESSWTSFFVLGPGMSVLTYGFSGSFATNDWKARIAIAPIWKKYNKNINTYKK